MPAGAPAQQRVIRRAVVLATLAHQATLDPFVDQPGVQAELEKATAWLQGLQLDDELEPEEKALLQTPLG
jgi:hypothetical protein